MGFFCQRDIHSSHEIPDPFSGFSVPVFRELCGDFCDANVLFTSPKKIIYVFSWNFQRGSSWYFEKARIRTTFVDPRIFQKKQIIRTAIAHF